ncbi:molecular chaperone GrpE [Chromobacterium alkanivorans]|uniref:nucleotide exchange factor GrpE n=1 Tax=Chromobacterium alkanivorans TaxID=1071719 RepID=UPI0023EEE7C2|nr:nucleotide exchange factor GrpE [Chromobacterium alkanivorans]MCS3806362.1 molecular chaperone GrpE [Chromobacterium alkanivorans]MCS3820626.1 molecular chaperone GrpE [Chromobacterium alkanivorans]MCS3875384.1 molecular chaperone GrpE [Chromobacterium alkanivorans]
MQDKQNIAADAVDNDNIDATVAEQAVEQELSAEQQIAALDAEVAELKDALLRARADLENQRRRSQEDVAAAHKYAISKFAGELVSVKDYLEMALLDQSGQIDTLKMGVDMTLKQLVSAFDKAQIKDIAPLAGDKLDPHQHQAMSAEEADAEPNTIVRVMQKGYQISDRVLRPAMVVVAKAKA